MDKATNKTQLRLSSLGGLLLLYSLTATIFYLAFTESYTPNNSLNSIRLFVFLLFTPILLKYLLHLSIAPFYSVIGLLRRNTSFRPTVSVLIPAYNEEVGIVQTIESVIATEYPDLEIIIINDGSTDNTHSVTTKFLSNLRKVSPSVSDKITYKYYKNAGKAKALNKALKIAKGEIIVTVDADCIMHKDAIVHLLNHYTSSEVASVAGNVIIGNRSKPIGLLQQLEYLYGFYFKRAESVLNAVYIVGGAAASYRKSVLDKVGGFTHTTLTEDIELSTRLQDKGYKVRYASNAIVYTEGPSDFKGLFNQRLRWKHGRLQTFYKYRHLFFSFEKKHNAYLSFIILPIAFFAEVLLFFEFFLLGVFFIYTALTFDFIPLVIYILFLTWVIFLQVFSDHYPKYHFNMLFIAPVAWILFYIIDYVEYQALVRSIWKFVSGKEVHWQKWERVGVF